MTWGPPDCARCPNVLLCADECYLVQCRDCGKFTYVTCVRLDAGIGGEHGWVEERCPSAVWSEVAPEYLHDFPNTVMCAACCDEDSMYIYAVY